MKLLEANPAIRYNLFYFLKKKIEKDFHYYQG